MDSSPSKDRLHRLKENTLLSVGLQAALIVLLTLLVYIPVVQGGFIWDDDLYVTENPRLRSTQGLAQIWLEPRSGPQYYPLVFSTFWVEYQIWGLHPVGYHLVNILLHGLNAVLLWLLLRRLEVPGGWVAAMVFALHPVQVETVAWVTERKNVLSALFYFSSALCLLRYFRLDDEAEEQQRRELWYGFAFLLFMCGLLSKTVTCSLPAAVILVLWWKRGRVRRSELAALVPFFLVGLVMGFFTVWLERHHVGAQGLEWELSAVERLLLAGRALWFYAGKLFWPTGLTFNYARWQVDAGVWWQVAYPLTVLVVVSLLWAVRRRVGRGPLVGVLFFCGTLIPALGFFDVYPFRFSYVADHFQYLASVGLITLSVAAIAHGASRPPPWSKPVVISTGSLLLVLLAAQTWRQGHIYENSETLWTDTIIKNPESWLAHNNLGNIRFQQGKLHVAEKHFSEALRLKPDLVEAHNNLGMALDIQSRQQAAIDHFTEALRIEPDYAEAHNNLGAALAGLGRLEEARVHFRKALKIRSDYAEAHHNLGLAFAKQGSIDQAILQYLEALRLDPRYAEAHNHLGLALTRQGRLEEAIAHFTEALRLQPETTDIHNNLGAALARQGKFDDALAHYSKARKIQARQAEAHNRLGLALTRERRFEEAIAHFTEALRIKPDSIEVYNNLGVVLTGQGKMEEAIHYFSQALKIDPNYAEAHNNLGLTLAAYGNIPEAVFHFSEALRIRPDYAEARKNLLLFSPSTGKSSGQLSPDYS
jgi:tetratricopeptide (TPR) repeat protein